MKKKQIIVGIAIFLLIVLSVGFVWASVEDNCEVTLQTNSTEITQSQRQVTIMINLDAYDGDGYLGYEGTLQYDTNVFEDATITSLSDWETANYDKASQRIMATTTTAKAGTQIAQITLDLKEGITKTSATVSITDLIFSDGNTQKTFSQTFNYSFPYNAVEEEPNTDPEENPNANVLTNQVINVVTNQVVNQVVNETANTIQNTAQNITIEAVAGANRDQTTATTTIPQTGSGLGWIVTLGVIGVIGIAAYIRYRSIPLK